MSYAALISGMLTLIATTPNLVVHEELKAAGHEGFGFFSFLLVGVAVLAVAVVYILFIGRRLLSRDASPYLMLSVIFFLTAGLGLVLSNTASAVLVAPIAIYMPSALDISPYPFAVAVLIAASAAYSTPVSTPVVTLVVEPGRYKFTDFVRVGVPLLFLTYLVTLAVAPLIFPFHPA